MFILGLLGGVMGGGGGGGASPLKSQTSPLKIVSDNYTAY